MFLGNKNGSANRKDRDRLKHDIISTYESGKIETCKLYINNIFHPDVQNIDFLITCMNDGVEKCEKLIEEKNITNYYVGFITSIIFENINLVKFFIDKEIYLKKFTYGDYNILTLACRFENFELIKLLIDNGLNINELDNGKRTPFLIACKSGSSDFVEFLIKEGIDINDNRLTNTSGFIIACESNYLDIVKLLISHKINVNKKDQKGESGFVRACSCGYYDIVKYLLDTIGANSIYDLYDAFITSCNNGHANIVEYMVNFLEDYSIIFKSFIKACTRGNYDIVKILALDTNIDKKDEYEKTGLMYACIYDRIIALRVLTIH